MRSGPHSGRSGQRSPRITATCGTHSSGKDSSPSSAQNTDTYGVSKRLRDRISYFLADNQATQTELHDKVRACYAQRSAIVHGRWEDSQEFHDVHMYTTEAIVRTVVRHMASKPGMLDVFLSPQRNEFLEAWVTSKVYTPPPGF